MLHVNEGTETKREIAVPPFSTPVQVLKAVGLAPLDRMFFNNTILLENIWNATELLDDGKLVTHTEQEANRWLE